VGSPTPASTVVTVKPETPEPGERSRFTYATRTGVVVRDVILVVGRIDDVGRLVAEVGVDNRLAALAAQLRHDAEVQHA
jgi:hypothetical protein